MGPRLSAATFVATALLMMTLAACLPQDVADFQPEPPAGQLAPDAIVPTNLHVTSHLRRPPTYDLRWVAPAEAGIDRFIVYRSAAPITAENRAAATAVTVPGDQRALPVELSPDSGGVFLRISSVGTDGVESALSSEYAIDTTSRVAFRADKNLDERYELFAAGLTGGEPARISGVVPLGRNVSSGFAWSPDARRIAWIADTDQENVDELFVAPADGLLPPQKLSGALSRDADVLAFAWSPDARTLAFISDRDRDEVYGLYVVSADGNLPPVKVSPIIGRRTGLDGVRAFAWSPDGRQIAYVADDRFDEVLELFVVPAERGPAVRVSGSIAARTGGERGITAFAWSPEGNALAYSSDEDHPGVIELFTVAPTGGSVRRISGPMTAGGNVVEFLWSPASDRVAFLADRQTAGTVELWIASVAGGPVANLSGPLLSGANVLPGFAWSRDGLRIAFRSDKDLPGTVALYAVSPEGGIVTRLSGTVLPDSDVAEGIAWAPSSARVAARLDTGIKGNFELYAIDPELPLLEPVNRLLSGAREVVDYTWSPDGSRLAYIADERVGGKFELFVAPAAGGSSTRISGNLAFGGNVTHATWSPLGN